MASTSAPIDLTSGPDLRPLYPTTSLLESLLSPESGLTPPQKEELVSHCLTRACVFADLPLLSYLLSERQAQPHIDLGSHEDDDGLGLVSLTIHGFGEDSERDVEREECVRLLITQGADMGPDSYGWTPLHHAALLAPPSLVVFVMTHGCSAFDTTRRSLTPLDIVTAHSLIPGREDVALILEESMRADGWMGGRVEQRRKREEAQSQRRRIRRDVRQNVGKTLGVDPKWWGTYSEEESESEDDADGNEDDLNDTIYTPHLDFTSMLVFSPHSLPDIFDSLITHYLPSLHDAQPANTLYLLARFACLTCDHTWLEDLIIGAADAIEDTFFNRADDVTCLVFWLYNTTIWLHLMRCDDSINEACEMLGSFELIEEVINSIFVFIIRFAEREIDKLLDPALLDHSPLASEFDSVQFESEWSFLRPFSGKKKAGTSTASTTTSAASTIRGTSTGSPPTSPSPSISSLSIRQNFARARASSNTGSTPLQMLFSEGLAASSPAELTKFLTALHVLLTLAQVNPALITQLWSQVFYWTSCEMFNRILTRKKHLCRSRAVQISVNLSAIEEWVDQMGLPPGVQSHFTPVRDLLNWLQCSSSITEFPNLVATIQTMKNINPLQMRRAVRDYRYEVNEGRMTEECIQYLTQLQKDWERHRVKIGVEALRKEIGEREREREESGSSIYDDANSIRNSPSISSSSSTEISVAQQGIDSLFERTQAKSSWEPARPPQALGELLDSRYMLPLVFPSDPRMLAALPGKLISPDEKRAKGGPEDRSRSRASERDDAAFKWRAKNSKVRQMDTRALQSVDGAGYASKWTRPALDLAENEADGSEDEDEDWQELRRTRSDVSAENGGDLGDEDTIRIDTHLTPLKRKASSRNKRRQGSSTDAGNTTPIDRTT